MWMPGVSLKRGQVSRHRSARAAKATSTSKVASPSAASRSAAPDSLSRASNAS